LVFLIVSGVEEQLTIFLVIGRVTLIGTLKLFSLEFDMIRRCALGLILIEWDCDARLAILSIKLVVVISWL
jgi:hypothetical protein